MGASISQGDKEMDDYRAAEFKDRSGHTHVVCVTNAVLFKLQKKLGLKGFAELAERLDGCDLELIFELVALGCASFDNADEVAECDVGLGDLTRAVGESLSKAASGPSPKRKKK